MGYWKCDESSGTTLADSSGNSKNLTITGTINTNYWLGEAGEQGTCFRTDGVAGFASRTDSVIPSLDNVNFTLFGLFKGGTDFTSGAAVSVSNSATANASARMGDRYGTGEASGLARGSTSVMVNGFHGGTAFDGTWHSAALRRNGTAFTLFVDGASVATTAATLATGSSCNRTSLMHLVDSGTHPFAKGSIQHAAIWNTALSDAELAAIQTARIAPAWPLKISANNHYLVDQNNVPFIIIGDSPWDMVTAFREPDIDAYLANRAAKGFNGIILENLEHYYSVNSPNNIDNVPPFLTPGDFSTANPAYFARMDYIVDKARDYGMVVVIFLDFIGSVGGVNPAGWHVEMAADTTAHLQAYATFLGNRYKNKGNIIWVQGGDCDPADWGLLSEVDAMGVALKAADPNHLITEHVVRGAEAVQPWLATGVPSWLTLNCLYNGNLTFTAAQGA